MRGDLRGGEREETQGNDHPRDHFIACGGVWEYLGEDKTLGKKARERLELVPNMSFWHTRLQPCYRTIHHEE